MDAYQLLFWKSTPAVRLSSAEIARELLWGEDVEGLIDLPVREIIDRLRAEFPQHEEKSGVLVGHDGDGSFEATWTWQHIRVDCRNLSSGQRDRLIEAVESLGCMAYDPQHSQP